MNVRLISANGELIAQTTVKEQTEAIIFANHVFLKAFSVASFEYYREISATKVSDVSTLRADFSERLTENES